MTPETQQKIFEVAREIEQIAFFNTRHSAFFNEFSKIGRLAESIQSLAKPDGTGEEGE